MRKKLIVIKNIFFSLLTIFFISSSTTFSMGFPGGMGGMPGGAPPQFEMPSQEEIDKVLVELEKIFGDLDDEDFKPIEPKKDIKKPVKKDAKPAPTKKVSKEEQFSLPAKPSKEETVVKKLSPEKIEAFDFYISRFIKTIQEIEKQINSFKLGIAFKEELEDIKSGDGKIKGFNNIINALEIEYGILKSRKLYQKIFYLDSFTKTRKQIIKTSEKLETILKEINKQKEPSEKEVDLVKKDTKKAIKKDLLIPLKADIKNIFTKEIAQIGTKTREVSDGGLAKTAIEEKKKKRELMAKKSEEERKRTQRYADRYSPSPWRGGSPYQPSPWSPSRQRTSYPGRRSSSSPYSPWARPSSPRKPTDYDYDSNNDYEDGKGKKDKDKNGSGSTQKSRAQKRNGVIDETISLIENVVNIFKDGKENTYTEILGSEYMSRISQNLLGIAGLGLSQENKNQKIPTTQKIDTKLIQALKKLIIPSIRLAKHYSGDPKERKASQQITTKLKPINELKAQTVGEIKKYNEKIRRELNTGILGEFNPDTNNFDKTIKRLIMVLSPPMDDETQVNPIKTVVTQTKRNKENLIKFLESNAFQQSTAAQSNTNQMINVINAQAQINNIWKNSLTDELYRAVAAAPQQPGQPAPAGPQPQQPQPPPPPAPAGAQPAVAPAGVAQQPGQPAQQQPPVPQRANIAFDNNNLPGVQRKIDQIKEKAGNELEMLKGVEQIFSGA